MDEMRQRPQRRARERGGGETTPEGNAVHAIRGKATAVLRERGFEELSILLRLFISGNGIASGHNFYLNALSFSERCTHAAIFLWPCSVSLGVELFAGRTERISEMKGLFRGFSNLNGDFSAIVDSTSESCYSI